MYAATTVTVHGGRLTMEDYFLVRQTSHACLQELDRGPGEVIALWEFPDGIAEATALSEARRRRPDALMTRHPLGFVLTLHEEHLTDVVAAWVV